MWISLRKDDAVGYSEGPACLMPIDFLEQVELLVQGQSIAVGQQRDYVRQVNALKSRIFVTRYIAGDLGCIDIGLDGGTTLELPWN